jgi:DHA1 family bicyclomycin/chloramphenicol resistance-like MFS transporter
MISQTNKSTFGFALLMAALAALGPFSVDTYFPSFPAIARHFQVTPLQVQSTLSFYLAALSVMSLFHGAISDSFGRRPVILCSLIFYTLTALACPFAPNFGVLLLCRTIQGLAGGSGMIVGRAMIRDRFQGHEAQKFLAQVTIVSGLAPVVAPVLGGWLHVWFGWRGPFLFLALLGGVVLLACYLGMPESLPKERRHRFHPATLTRGYLQVLRNPGFLALSLSLSLGGGGFLLYVATAPDVVLNILKLTETQFAWLFVPNVSGLILGSIITTRVAGRVASRHLVQIGFAFMAAAALLNLGYSYFFTPRVPWAVLPLFLHTLGFALCAPIAVILSLDLFPRRRGLASSLQGFLQTVVFALVSSVIARLVYGSGFKHAVVMALMLAINWLGWRLFLKQHPWPPQDPLRPDGPDKAPGVAGIEAGVEWRLDAPEDIGEPPHGSSEVEAGQKLAL